MYGDDMREMDQLDRDREMRDMQDALDPYANEWVRPEDYADDNE